MLDVFGAVVGGIAWAIAIYLALLVPDCPWYYYMGYFSVAVFLLLMNLEPITPYAIGLLARFLAYLLALGAFAWGLQRIQDMGFEARPSVVFAEVLDDLFDDNNNNH